MAQQSSLQEKFNNFLAGDYQVLRDRQVTGALAPTLVHLFETGKNQVAERLIQRLIQGMENEDTYIRQICSLCLVETAEILAGKQMWVLLDKLLPSLNTIQPGTTADWVPENVRKAAARIIAAAENREGKQKQSSPLEGEKKKDSLAIREEQIFQLFHSGNKEEAKQQLFDLVVECARKKDFKNAERLRERIYEIDPMALMEIIQSGEIIEEEKIGSINNDLLHTWDTLLQSLSQEEFNALYLLMEKRELQAEEILVPQGTENDELFFINRGSVRISYFQTGTGGVKEVFLKKLESGQIAGENFFNATIWTVTLTAVKDAHISILKRNDIPALEESNPGFETKLREYYKRSFNIAGLLNKKGIDRRTHERFKVRRIIELQIMGKSGKVLSTFKGDMTDISVGGLSFFIRITKQENSRLLLGRHIKATVPRTHGGEQKINGTVLGVQSRDRLGGDYSVHVKFDEEMKRQQLQFIIE